MLVSLQDQENNQKPQTTPAIEVLGYIPPVSTLKTSTCGSTQTSIMQSISSSVQQSGNTSSPGSHNLMTYSGATHVPSEYARYMLSKLAFSISTPQSDSVLGQLNTVPKQCHTVHSNHPTNINISLQQNCSNSRESASNYNNTPIINLSTLEDLDHGQWCVVQAHLEQLEEMEALCCKEGTLLCQQPAMAFGEYVHKLVDIMERKARCVQSMIAQLQPYLKPSNSNKPHNREEDNQYPINLIN
ncbi:uncharacterized protein LOC117736718 [Cyclopterus lumpus]|uniref:uncharacterized protein LOC117736718 n=1 Tax=Cyclopterus lumpus TaxID=8103 RepID=UPI001485FD9E|nr:uncharacterized protein LOC117736718 [Cyclopterus lumpus]